MLKNGTSVKEFGGKSIFLAGSRLTFSDIFGGYHHFQHFLHHCWQEGDSHFETVMHWTLWLHSVSFSNIISSANLDYPPQHVFVCRLSCTRSLVMSGTLNKLIVCLTVPIVTAMLFGRKGAVKREYLIIKKWKASWLHRHSFASCLLQNCYKTLQNLQNCSLSAKNWQLNAILHVIL